MKTFTVTLLVIGLAMTQTIKEVVLSDDGEKTVEEVQANLECLKKTDWNDFFETNMPGLGVQYIRSQMSKGATPNKKYYIQVNESHNVMYFKEGTHYFMHLNEIQDDGSDHMLLRAFVQDDFQNCIQVLPDSCKWKGERVVKYIEVCEKGLVLAEGFTQDFFRVVLDDDEGVFSPIDIAKAIRDCYQPNIYSIAYKCYTDKLYFDPQYAVSYLKDVEANLQQHGFETKLDLETMEIKYAKTHITVNGVEVAVDPDLSGGN